MPELGIVFPPWALGMKTMFRRIFASMIVGVVVVLVVEWRLADPGPWPVVLIAAFSILGVAWAIHGALPEIREMREEADRSREAFLRS